MVAKRKKKYTTGEGAQFLTRKAALKKLQLSLNDFRRLCILKGIYPREPRNRKRAQKGQSGIKTLYHVKDIQFLLHEPVIWKLRDYKIFNKKVGRARAVKDFEKLHKYLQNHPTLKLDHIVKERYPSFVDALRDLDDCLTLCYLFSTFPSLAHVPRDQSALCRRLTLEFMHCVIEAKALRKVFISIKGYYYQAELKGQTITWIVPHHFAFEPQQKSEVDFKIMSIFVEFYTVMLGFINFRLYNSLNLYYPPKMTSASASESEKALVDEEAFVSERVAALNFPLSKTAERTDEEEVEIDNFNMEDSPEKIEEAKQEAEKIKTLKTLFKGLKFFLNREVPREPLVFIIRCFGGEVSWDKTLFVGSTFDETDESITHQIVDRPSMPNQYISRYYIQPQWLFDSVNARQLLPVNKYFMGEILPPHLSPFIDKSRDQQYIPPEERALYDPSLLEEQHKKDEEQERKEEEGEDAEESGSEEEEGVDNEEEENEKQDDKNKDAEETEQKKPRLSVTAGEIYKEVPWEKNRQERQEYRLREKMIQKKYKKLYKSMMEGKQDRAKEIWLLRKKRRLLEEKAAEEKKTKNKAKKEQPAKEKPQKVDNKKVKSIEKKGVQKKVKSS